MRFSFRVFRVFRGSTLPLLWHDFGTGLARLVARPEAHKTPANKGVARRHDLYPRKQGAEDAETRKGSPRTTISAIDHQLAHYQPSSNDDPRQPSHHLRQPITKADSVQKRRKFRTS